MKLSRFACTNATIGTVYAQATNIEQSDSMKFNTVFQALCRPGFNRIESNVYDGIGPTVELDAALKKTNVDNFELLLTFYGLEEDYLNQYIDVEVEIYGWNMPTDTLFISAQNGTFYASCWEFSGDVASGHIYEDHVLRFSIRQTALVRRLSGVKDQVACGVNFQYNENTEVTSFFHGRISIRQIYTAARVEETVEETLSSPEQLAIEWPED